MKSLYAADIRENHSGTAIFGRAKNIGVTKGGNSYLTLKCSTVAARSRASGVGARGRLGPWFREE